MSFFSSNIPFLYSILKGTYVDICPICILVKYVVFISQNITLFKATQITVEAIEMVETIEVVKTTDEIRPEIPMKPGGGLQTDLSVMTQI